MLPAEAMTPASTPDRVKPKNCSGISLRSGKRPRSLLLRRPAETSASCGTGVPLSGMLYGRNRPATLSAKAAVS
jgi:hypothetical protein